MPKPISSVLDDDVVKLVEKEQEKYGGSLRFIINAAIRKAFGKAK